MRFRRLRLLAFGHFTDVEIDLGDAPALHLIYGPNEAGKSTALRAITGLLYGIPVTTTDSHLHHMRDLRIGADLLHGGEVLSVVRRKGNTNTLLDARGVEAMPELPLRAMLAGVDEATFRSMFGLDHESLRAGAEALLEGRGSVGESLFDAGFGGRGIQKVLSELRQEADELYRPRGQRQAVNEALRRFRDAKEARANASVRPDAWVLQVEELERARAESRNAIERRRALVAEQNALQRARRVLPLLTRRRGLLDERRGLGEVALLEAAAASRRQAALRQRDEVARDQRRLEAEIAARVEQLTALRIPAAIAALDAQAVETLQQNLGEHRKSLVDLPKREAELDLRQKEVARLAAVVGLPPGTVEIDRARLGLRAQAAVRRLATQRAALDASAADTRRRLAQRRGELEELRARAARHPAPPDGGEVREALDALRSLADTPDKIDELDREIAAARERLRTAPQRLAPWQGDAESLRLVAPPSAEVIDRIAREMDQNIAARADIERRCREVEERLAENRRDRRIQERLGSPPTERDVSEARQRRDELWQRAKVGKKPPSADLASDIEDAIEAADDLADRLYREADRVAAAARLQADAEHWREALANLSEERSRLAESAAQLDERWRALWRELDITPGPPAEMRDWLIQYGAVLAETARLAELGAERDRLEGRYTERRIALERALRRASGSPASDERPAGEERAEGFAVLVRRAQELSDRWDAQRRACEDLARSIDGLEREVARESLALSEQEAQAATWRAEWEKAVSPLGLAAEASSEEALAVLDGLVALVAKIEEAEAMRARVAAIEIDIDTFRAAVTSVVQGSAPHLAGLGAVESAQRLVGEHRRVMIDVESRARLEGEIAERRAELESLADLQRFTDAELQSLCEAAGVAEVEALQGAEEKSAQALALDAAIVDVERDLIAAGEGASVEDLVAQTQGIDVDGVRARLDELETEIETLTEDIDRLGRDIGSKERGLSVLENERGAAGAAAIEQESLADLASRVRRYVRVALAAQILSDEVERYRRDNQGPILTRANVFFPRLTLGNYRELRVGYDSRDVEVLRCVRADGSQVDVGALSDGTRDQLYLALRLATLEHFAESREPLPLILDDVFIHFDDQRTEAALAVLGAFAATTQILLFTHHARLLELARKAVPADRRVEHDLSVLRGAARRAAPEADDDRAAISVGDG